MKNLLVVTAVIEVGAGVALLGFPSATVGLLLGPPLHAPPPATLVRSCGAVLLALGFACWLASRDTGKPSARRMVAVMTAYNLSAAAVLGMVGMRAPSVGILLWPAVVLHAATALWCAVRLFKVPLRGPENL